MGRKNTCCYVLPIGLGSSAFRRKGCYGYLILSCCLETSQYHHVSIRITGANHRFSQVRVIILLVVDSVSTKTSISKLMRERIPLHFNLIIPCIRHSYIGRYPAGNYKQKKAIDYSKNRCTLSAMPKLI